MKIKVCSEEIEPMFKIGDLVTGVDRSYQRSIYKVIKHVDGHSVQLLFIHLGFSIHNKVEITYPRLKTKFRLATDEEIGLSMIGYSLKLYLMYLTIVLLNLD